MKSISSYAHSTNKLHGDPVNDSEPSNAITITSD